MTASALLVVFLWAAAPVARGHLGPIWDADGFFAPFYSLVADFARHGRLLLWNPWSSGGSPDFAEPQIGAASPLILVSALLTGGTSAGFRWHWLATWFAGPVGMLLLARRFAVPPLGAFLVALGFAFSGPFTGNAEHVSFMRSFVLLPFIVERVEAARSGRRLLPALQAGALWGLTALGGYPALVFIDVMFVGLWLLGRWLFEKSPSTGTGPRRVADLRRFLVGAASAGLLGAVILLPPFIGMLTEGNGYSTRTEALTRDYAIASNALGPKALSSVFSPYLGALPPTLWPATDISSADVYCGAIPLFFALCALVARPRSGWRWWLLGMAAFFIALAVGPTLPVRGWLYDLVPPTRFFRHASVFRLPAIFAVLALALEGAKDLLEQPRPRSKPLPLVLAASLLVGVAVWSYLAVSRQVATPNQEAGDTHFTLMWIGILVTAAFFAGAGGTARGGILARAAGLVLLAALAVFDAGQAFALTSATVGSADTVPGWLALDQAHVSSLDLLANGKLARIPVTDGSTGFGPGPTNKNLVVKQPAFMAYPSLRNPMFEGWAGNPALLGRVLPEQRTFFSPGAVEMDRSQPSFDAFTAYVTRTGLFPLVVQGGRTGDSPPAPTPALERAPAAQPLPVRLTTYDPDRLVAEFTAPASGWVLVTERWAPGWSAKLDGRAVPIQVGDFLFRAVQTPAGLHTLEMRYRPWGHPWVVGASWLAVAGVAAASLAAAWRQRRSHRLADLGGGPAKFEVDGTSAAS